MTGPDRVPDRHDPGAWESLFDDARKLAERGADAPLDWTAVGQFVDGFLAHLDEQKKGSEHG